MNTDDGQCWSMYVGDEKTTVCPVTKTLMKVKSSEEQIVRQTQGCCSARSAARFPFLIIVALSNPQPSPLLKLPNISVTVTVLSTTPPRSRWTMREYVVMALAVTLLNK